MVGGARKGRAVDIVLHRLTSYISIWRDVVGARTERRARRRREIRTCNHSGVILTNCNIQQTAMVTYDVCQHSRVPVEKSKHLILYYENKTRTNKKQIQTQQQEQEKEGKKWIPRVKLIRSVTSS